MSPGHLRRPLRDDESDLSTTERTTIGEDEEKAVTSIPMGKYRIIKDRIIPGHKSGIRPGDKGTIDLFQPIVCHLPVYKRMNTLSPRVEKPRHTVTTDVQQIFIKSNGHYKVRTKTSEYTFISE